MTQKKPGIGERFRYWFDGWMSRGTGALIALLAIATAVLVVIVTVITFALGSGARPQGQPHDFPDLLWATLMRAIDSGTLAGDNGWGYRGMMLVITIAGIVIVASLISIISGAFDAKVDELRKGRSRVLETDHTLILGWSHKVFSLIHEISVANESRGRSAIVILADVDKVEMEDAIRTEVGATGRTRIVCRTGDPMNLRDLELGNPDAARSIIVLGADGDEDPDATVIKTTLALTNNKNRKADPYHIVGELKHGANLEAGRLVGRNEAHWVLALDLISRVTVQSCRQSGLSVVYTELLDFDGDEIYFTDQPNLYGSSYFATQIAFSTCTVIGIVTPDTVLINPAPDTVYAAGQQLIVIAEDDSTIRLGAEPTTPDESAIAAPQPFEPEPEHTVILGVNSGLRVMLDELHSYVAPGSTVTIVADEREPQLPDYPGMPVTFTRADPTQRGVLDSLLIGPHHHVIVLAARDALPAQRADAKTLITLLLLREIADEQGAELNVVSEMLDDRNRELAEVTKADDFIVSEKLVSLMLSQVSENERLSDVFGVLFDSAGSEVYIRPAELYVKPGVEVDFYTIAEAARRVGETAIGYRISALSHDADAAYGVHVNPPKADRVAFAAGDRVVVLSEQ
jgi:voltage-gated potassium channel Kch